VLKIPTYLLIRCDACLQATCRRVVQPATRGVSAELAARLPELRVIGHLWQGPRRQRLTLERDQYDSLIERNGDPL
jgi:hypothetical protein